MTRHLVLLGDSIFDNASYIPGRRPAVIDQVRNRLPEGWSATLLALDGSVVEDVHRQLERLPADASHLALSVGGNDLLLEVGILRERVTSVAEGLRLVLESRSRFDKDYRKMMEAIRDRGLPTIVCAVYNPCSDDDAFQRAAIGALCMYNDCIIDNARKFKLPVLDLRVVCSEIADYANEIEPSALGGAKIAEALCQITLGYDFESRKSVLFP